MKEETESGVSVIRSVKRKDLSDLRSKHKEILLGNKRLGLQDVSKYIQEITLTEFNELLSKLKQKSVPLEVLKKIKNSCICHEYIEALVRNDGALNSLVRIFIGKDAQKQLEAAACLTNIACGSHKCTYKVAKTSGAYLVSFTTYGSNHFLQEQSSWALANIANDCMECFSIIKSQGVLGALLNALQSPSLSVRRSVIFALNSCTQYEDPKVISAIQPSFIRCLLSLLEENNFDMSIFLDTAFTLSNCCFISTKYSVNRLDIAAVERILLLLLKVTFNAEISILVATPLVRCLGFLSYDYRICEFLALHPEFFPCIQILINKEDCIHLSKEAMWVLSNVVAGATNFDVSHLMPIIDSLKVNLRPENPMIFQVLYFLSVLASKHESLHVQLKQHEVFTQIKCLLEREDNNVVEAVTVFLNIVKKK